MENPRNILCVLGSLLVPSVLCGQTPLGTEFRVNTYTTNTQYSRGVASDASGNFVVVWDSYQDGDLTGVFAQRYASTGSTVGTEFQVNTYTTNQQFFSAVASDAIGNFVVMWESFPQDGAGSGIFGQRFDNTGSALGSEFQLNSYTTGFQSYPVVAIDANGNVVVVWRSDFQDGDGAGIVGRRFESTGGLLGTCPNTPGGRVSPTPAPSHTTTKLPLASLLTAGLV